jgi:two-component system, OmpR family, sensor histidine kinase SenX3
VNGSSRLLSWLAVGASALALVWALLGLHAVFREELDETHATSAAQRRTLEEYAAQALRESLARRLRAVREAIGAAETDPLQDDRSFFVERAAEQLLPRTAAPRASDESPSRDLHAALLADPRTVKAEPGSPWAERLTQLHGLHRALERGDEKGVESAVRTILRDRARYRIAAPLDIPCVIALLDLLSQRSHPNPELLARVLRDGFDAAPLPVPGVQRALLAAAERFTRADFAFLAERIVALSEGASVRHDDFLERARAGPGPRVPSDPAQRGPYVAGDAWYIEPQNSGRAVGVRIALDEQIGAVETRMRERRLLSAEDRLEVARTPTSALPLASVGARIESARWSAALERADSRYALKTALALVCGLLSIALIAAALLAHERRLRLLAQRTEFVAAVSHELRTPLASIRLQAETLARRLAGRSEARDYPQRIVRDVDGLHFLVENILSYNRLERGGWRPQRSSVSLRALALKLQQELDGQTPRKLEVIVEPSADVALHADADLIRLLFANLLRNAAQYSERDPAVVHVSCEDARHARRILLKDSGLGIPEALRERVFDAFFRTHPASPVRGSGLGLAICRRIVRAHGGSIRVAESSPRGTTFEILLPVGPRQGD